MGIRERHERDREAVRRAILDAARELFVHEGYPNVSIRKIAERIEYSPAAIYSYFPSKDDIFFELAEEGFRLLSRPDNLAQLDALAPLDRLRAIGSRLWAFSCEYPEYFALMFVERSVPRITREYERFAFLREMRAHLAQRVQECIDAGALPPTLRPAVALRLFMMSIVGVATMRLSDRIAPGEDADALAHDMMETMIAGLQSAVALRSADCAIPPCSLDPGAAAETPTRGEADAPAARTEADAV